MYENVKVRGELPFIRDVDAIRINCVDNAKQVLQGGLEHAQFELI